MPRYFFWNEDGECHPDNEGVELSGHDEARRYGLRVLCEIVTSKAAEFFDTGEWKLTVKDREGLILFMLVIGHIPGAVQTQRARSRDHDSHVS